MSLTITAASNQRIAPMGNDRAYYGFGSFSGSATTAEVFVPFKKVKLIVACYIGTPALADGPISVNETVTNDVISTPAAGSHTVTRVAGTTADLKFSFVAFGN